MTIDGRIVAGAFILLIAAVGIWLVTAVELARPLLPAPLALGALGTIVLFWGLASGGKAPSEVGKRVRGARLGAGLGVAAVAGGVAVLAFSGVEVFGVQLHFVGFAIAAAIVAFAGVAFAGLAFERICKDCDEPFEHGRFALADRRAVDDALKANDASTLASLLAQATKTSAAESLHGPSRTYADIEWCPSCTSVALIRSGSTARWLTRADARTLVHSLSPQNHPKSRTY